MRKKLAAVCLTLIIFLAACESGPRVRMAPGFDQSPTPPDVQANVMGTPEPTAIPPTPTVEPLELNDRLFTDPSRTLSFYPPLGWELVEEKTGYVKFVRADGAAWFEGAVESSGYTLPPEAYNQYIENMLMSLYHSTVDYKLLKRDDLEDRTVVRSSFMKGDQQWYAMDFFLQRGQALYALSFQAHEWAWGDYKDKFFQIIDEVRTQTGYLKDNLIYIFKKPYTAPGGLFEIYVPMGWGLTRDDQAYPDGVLETIASPDDEAHVDVIVLDGSQRLANLDIGQASIAILKERINPDLRIIGDDVLADGRIRVDWIVDQSGESGYSFFWLDGSWLYLVTYWHTGEHAGLYQRLLFEIGDSFNLLKAENPEAS